MREVGFDSHPVMVREFPSVVERDRFLEAENTDVSYANAKLIDMYGFMKGQKQQVNFFQHTCYFSVLTYFLKSYVAGDIELGVVHRDEN